MQRFRSLGLVRFLEKIDFALSLFWCGWSFLVLWCSLFFDCDRLIIEIPYWVAVPFTVPLAALTLWTWYLYRRDPESAPRMWIFLGVNAIGPLVYNAVMLFLADYLYDYSGVFLGGLGQLVIRILLMGLCAVFLIAFGIVWAVRRHRTREGKELSESAREVWADVKSVLNAVLFGALILTVLGLGISAAYQEIETRQSERHLSRISAFREEMLSKAPRDAGEGSPYEEIRATVMGVEWMADGTWFDLEAENGNIFRITHVSQTVVEEGAAACRELKRIYTLEKPFSDGIDMTEFDPDKRTVRYETIVYASGNGYAKEPVRMILTYDENWDLKKIEFETPE